MSDKKKIDGVINGGDDIQLPRHMNYGAFMLEKMSNYKNKVAFVSD